MSNGQRLFVHISEDFYKLDGLTILDANLLALIAAFRGEGLRLSNNRLAELFNIERCTVIRSINKLRDKNYITNKDSHWQKRRLIARGVILRLLDSTKMIPSGSKMRPEVASKSYKTGIKTLPITKGTEEKVSTALPLPASEGRASAEQPQSDPQEAVVSLEDRRKMLNDIPDSPFKRAIGARRR